MTDCGDGMMIRSLMLILIWTRSSGGLGTSQLRFERHPSVYKLFLNMLGERNQSSQLTKLEAYVILIALIKPFATLPCKHLITLH